MKKRILCAIMSAIMAVGMMTGCGSKEATSNKTVENVSDKTEEKYVERMEAYLDYFQSEEKEYDGVVGAAITLDENSLPLLWLAFAESKEDDDYRFQLCSYDESKVNVLAEKKINDVDGMYPCNGVGIIGMQLVFNDGDRVDGTALIYDSEEQDFKFYDKDYFENADYFNSSNYKNEDDIEKNYEAMMKDLDVYRIANGQLQFLTLNNNGKTAYLGQMDENDIYYKYLDTIGALDDSVIKNDLDAWRGIRCLSNEFKDNAFVSKVYNDHFSEYLLQPTIYLPDGTETDQEGMCEYFGITEDAIGAGLSFDKTGCLTPYLSDMDAEAVMRRLIKNPAYTAFDILIVYGKELGNSGHADDLKFGDIVEVKELLKDAANNKYNSVDSTESTESIKREDSTEISKETNNNMPAWKQAYIDYINGLDEQIDAYRLVDINSDNIPEIYYQYHTKTSAKLLYLNHADEVKTLDAIHASSNFGYNSRGIVDGFTRTGVTTELMYKYDSSKDEYIQIFHGSYTDGIGNNGVKQYKINGVEVPIDEYITAFNQADLNSEFNNFNEESMLTSGDIVSAIQNY